MFLQHCQQLLNVLHNYRMIRWKVFLNKLSSQQKAFVLLFLLCITFESTTSENNSNSNSNSMTQIDLCKFNLCFKCPYIIIVLIKCHNNTNNNNNNNNNNNLKNE